MTGTERALSELMAEIVIVILVAVLALVIIGMLTGVIPKLLQNTALISVQTRPYNTTAGANVIGLITSRTSA